MLKHRLLRPLRFWLLFLLIFGPLVAADAPTAEAQRSGVRARRARRARARRVRARRARVRRRRARRRRLRARRRGRRLPRRVESAPAESAPVDLDFVQEAEQYEAMDREAPPPMVIDDPAQREAERLQERRDNLDPELFGDTEQAGDTGHVGESPGPTAPGRFSPLRVRALLRAFNRGLSIVEPTRGDVADYQLAVGPAAGFGFEYYPGAHFTNSELAHVGIQFNFHHSFAVESGGPNGTTYPTNELSWLLGARYRAVLSPDVVLGAEVGAGQQSYHVERGDLAASGPVGVPFVDYSFLRIGGSARVKVGELTVGGRLAYLPSFDLGGIGAELGGGMGHGVEAGVVFLYPIGLGFSFIAELDARVFVLDFDSPPTSPSAASGAVDHYVGLNVGVEFDLAANAL